MLIFAIVTFGVTGGLLTFVSGLTLLGTTIPLRKLIELTFKARLKLFDLGLNAPDALDKLLCEL